ncbi:RHS repeat domain-containing protein [Hymenobacter montanus]|uniref:RHS repeat domain-containing protein n=1 Tax=Hymenobacter montanus TaxID=2771359 RepID=UPI00293BFC03|nr:RHS repeat domain-containing protein [Hymenobacter montanus]
MRGQVLPNVSLSGGHQLDSGPQLITTAPGGWQRYRTRLQFTAPGRLILGPPSAGASAILDELRLHPVDAQLTTYTYQPLVGVTSQTDPTGRTLFYEYDGLGRLLRTRDEQARILSQQQHHYAGH